MQLKSIIDEMVSLRRLDTRQAQVTIAALDLKSVVMTALADLQPLADGKNQRITVDLPADLPQVRADQQVLQFILGNLLSNAIKFTPDEGLIHVSASSGDGRVVIAVRDTGIGIPAEELTRIFQRFYQVEDSLRRKHGGIGLGLAIARGMAELIDGRISVESVVGQGSTFSLSLPQALVD
jgi:two-component system phosphate regulon sensor histidine kinase PhoR